ncbi:subtilisin-like protein [Ramicandelaber brevisporus]|nr:subtilisin-like protein [Ramicandelaber brevisporus]
MRVTSLLLLVATLSWQAAAVAPAGLINQMTGNDGTIVPGRYIIEMETNPPPPPPPSSQQAAAATASNDAPSGDEDSTASPIDAADIRSKAGAAASLVQSLAGKAKIRRQFGRAFPGVSVELSNDVDIDQIRKTPGVKRVIPVYSRQLNMMPSFVNSDPSAAANASVKTPFADPMSKVHTLTGLFEARAKFSGITGKGIKVGIIDTGIDYTHPDLGGCFGPPPCRVSYGKSFVDDDPNNVMDCFSHGTMVSGVVGASGVNVVGVAQDVTFGAYKISGCQAIIAQDDVIAAVEQSLADGMDVINMSLGWEMHHQTNPLAVAVENAVKQGLVVVSSSGNTGGMLMTAEPPGSAPGVIQVGGIENVNAPDYSFKISTVADPLPIADAYTAMYTDKFVLLPKMDLIRLDVTGTAASGCTASNMVKVPGSAVLFDSVDAQCGATVFKAMIDAKPSAVLVSSTASALKVSVDAAAAFGAKFPVVVISDAITQTIRNGLSSGNPVTFEGIGVLRTKVMPNGGHVTVWSSRGPTEDLFFKPHIVAPAGDIYSTYVTRKGLYITTSGTSLSSPYIAGVAALYLQQLRERKHQSKVAGEPAIVANALVNTARNVVPRPSGLFDGLDNPVNVGAGVVNITRLLDTTAATLLPSTISLNDTGRPNFFGMYLKRVTVTNNDPSNAVTFKFWHEAGISASPFSQLGPQQYHDSKANLLFVPPSVNVPPGQSRSAVVTIVPPASNSPSLYVYGGWIVATPSSGEVVKSVYMGVKGDYSKVPIFRTPTDSIAFSSQPLPDGTPVYSTTAASQVPTVSVTMGTQTRRLELLYEAHPDNHGTTSTRGLPAGHFGFLGYVDFVGRYRVYQLSLGGYVCEDKKDVVTSFDNSTSYCNSKGGSAKVVPSGKYRYVVRAQRPFTNNVDQPDAKQDIWYTFKSNYFYLNTTAMM